MIKNKIEKDLNELVENELISLEQSEKISKYYKTKNKNNNFGI